MPHISIHVIQSFAPNNLNRDDTGAPKDCIFGGVRRARVSSQAWKRAMRVAFREEVGLNGHRATRTRRIAEMIESRLAAQEGIDASMAADLADGVRDALDLGANQNSPRETAVLVLLTDAEVSALSEWAVANKDALVARRDALAAAEAPVPGGPKGATKGKKKAATDDAAWTKVSESAKMLLKSPASVDTALFGRMLAEVDGSRREAAASVAHAISTHAVRMEEDYFTAVDDFKDLDVDADPGAGMIGEVLFQSAVLYRYASLDTDDLIAGLGGDEELAREALACFVRAFTLAVPTGKQTTFAAHNLPSAVLVTVDSQPVSLANAFLAPIRPQVGVRLDESSWDALVREYGAVAEFTGTTTARLVAVLPSIANDVESAGADPLAGATRLTLADLPAAVAKLLPSA